METLNQPVIRRKLADEVRDRLLAMIRNGELHPGDRLPSERELMNRFSVGRPAVREALQSLGSAGLIEISHGERARIRVPDTRGVFDRIGDTMLHLLQTSPTTLEHLKEARIMFEVGMVRIAAQTAGETHLAKLNEALDRQRAALNDAPKFVKADMSFHTAIAAVSGNTVCELLSAAMLDWLFNFRRDLLRMPGSEYISLAEHERLFDAISKRNVEAAERAMVEHLTRANERYRILADAMARCSRHGGGGEA